MSKKNNREEIERGEREREIIKTVTRISEQLLSGWPRLILLLCTEEELQLQLQLINYY